MPPFSPVLELLQNSLRSSQGNHKHFLRNARGSPVLLTLVTGTLSVLPLFLPFLNLPPFASISPLFPVLLKPSMVCRLSPSPCERMKPGTKRGRSAGVHVYEG